MKVWDDPTGTHAPETVDTSRTGRKVREEQKTDRHQISGPTSSVGYRVAAIVCGVLVGVVLYALLSFAAYLFGGLAGTVTSTVNGGSLTGAFGAFTFGNVFHFRIWTFGVALVAAVTSWIFFRKRFLLTWGAQNVSEKMVNDHTEDVWIQTPKEMMEAYDYFPDRGGHMPMGPSSLLSHIGANNNGLRKVEIAKRYDKDVLDEDGDVVFYKGEIMHDEDGNPIMQTVPMIDDKFREFCFDSGKVIDEKEYRKAYDLTKISYNPDGSNRDKIGKYKTVADMVNDKMTLPYYEVGRPGGFYLVDTAPVNTMVCQHCM